MSKNRPNDYLGVNKIGKNIRKSPLHQPNFVNNGNNNSNNNNPARQQPQPQVYNISKSDFRSIVQQLTGSPSRNSNDPLPRPPINPPPKHPSMRLQRIRPPPLSPINRPPVVAHMAPMQPPPQGPPMAPHPGPFNYNNFARPPPPQFGQPSPRGVQPLGPGGSGWMNSALSPISAYMQQLQSCISDGGPNPYQPQSQAQAQPHGQPQMQFPGQAQGQGQPGLLPNPSAQPLASPRMNCGPALLPSPTSQFQLPSPSWFNMLSPTQRSPYPLLSPGSQFPPPLSPNFAFSPIGQSGILGPGPQPPLSPGIAFPLSPSGFFSFPSPRWRDP